VAETEQGSQPGAPNEWRAQVAASWFDLSTWLAERRRLLREPALALAPRGALAFGPVRFAVLVWVVWPALVASAIGTLSALVAPPPPSPLELRHATALALEGEAVRALSRLPAGSARATDAAGADGLRALHRELLRSARSPADTEAARVRYAEALDRYVANGAPQAARVLKHARAMRRIDEIPVRFMRAGLEPALRTLFSGIMLLLAARSFRRRLRRSSMRHAGEAERAYLYLLPASTLWLAVFSLALGIALPLLPESSILGGGAILALLLASWIVYWRRAPLLAGVVSGVVPPSRADVRTMRVAIIASSVVSLLQAAALAFAGLVAAMLLGLLMP
jgi:hypothetical protein